MYTVYYTTENVKHMKQTQTYDEAYQYIEELAKIDRVYNAFIQTPDGAIFEIVCKNS